MLSGMNVSIVLDRTPSIVTNLDVLSGKVVVRVASPVSITSVLVKLEGESTTRLLTPTTVQNGRPRPRLECHKVRFR